MSIRSDDRRRAPPAFTLAVAVILLVAAYLIGLGPLNWLASRGVIPEPAFDFLCQTLYFPVLRIDERTEFFNDHPAGAAYAEYVDWFADW